MQVRRLKSSAKSQSVQNRSYQSSLNIEACWWVSVHRFLSPGSWLVGPICYDPRIAGHRTAQHWPIPHCNCQWGLTNCILHISLSSFHPLLTVHCVDANQGNHPCVSVCCNALLQLLVNVELIVDCTSRLLEYSATMLCYEMCSENVRQLPMSSCVR